MLKGNNKTLKIAIFFLLRIILNLERNIVMFLAQNSFCLNCAQELHSFLIFVIWLFSNLEEPSAQQYWV